MQLSTSSVEDLTTVNLIRLVEKLRTENAQNLEDLEALRAQKEKYKGRATRLLETLEAERAMVARDAGSINDMTMQLKDLAESKDQEVVRVHAEMAELRGSVLQLQARARDARDEQASLEQRLGQAEADCERYRKALGRALRTAEIDKGVTATAHSTMAAADADIRLLTESLDVAHDTIEKLLAALSALRPRREELVRVCSAFDRRRIVPVFLDGAQTALSLTPVKHGRVLEPRDSEGQFIPLKAYRFMSLFAARCGVDSRQARELLVGLAAYFKEAEQEIRDAELAAARSEALALRRRLSQRAPYDAVKAESEAARLRVEARRYRELYHRLQKARPRAARVYVVDEGAAAEGRRELGLVRAELRTEVLKLKELINMAADVQDGAAAADAQRADAQRSLSRSILFAPYGAGVGVAVPEGASPEFIPFIAGAVQVARVMTQELELLFEKVRRLSRLHLNEVIEFEDLVVATRCEEHAEDLEHAVKACSGACRDVMATLLQSAESALVDDAADASGGAPGDARTALHDLSLHTLPGSAAGPAVEAATAAVAVAGGTTAEAETRARARTRTEVPDPPEEDSPARGPAKSRPSARRGARTRGAAGGAVGSAVDGTAGPQALFTRSASASHRARSMAAQ